MKAHTLAKTVGVGAELACYNTSASSVSCFCQVLFLYSLKLNQNIHITKKIKEKKAKKVTPRMITNKNKGSKIIATIHIINM